MSYTCSITLSSWSSPGRPCEHQTIPTVPLSATCPLFLTQVTRNTMDYTMYMYNIQLSCILTAQCVCVCCVVYVYIAYKREDHPILMSVRYLLSSLYKLVWYTSSCRCFIWKVIQTPKIMGCLYRLPIIYQASTCTGKLAHVWMHTGAMYMYMYFTCMVITCWLWYVNCFTTYMTLYTIYVNLTFTHGMANNYWTQTHRLDCT